jgi:deazaflavin-dependent oxidoreductase (nitroreductase family)
MNTTMNTTSPVVVPGRPHFSGPIRAIAKAFGPLAKPLAGNRSFPLWAILRHTGRKSGKVYETPVVARPTPDGFIIPLPFGNATQWAKNLLASGGGSLRFAGQEYLISEPRLVDLDEASAHLAAPIRFVSRRLGLRHWVLLRTVSS